MDQNKIKSPAKKGITAVIAIVVAVVVLLNVGVRFIPEALARYDITVSESYTLSDTTVKYLNSIKENITLYVFDADGSDMKYEYLLRRLNNCSDKVEVKWVKSDNSEDILKPLGISADTISPYVLVCESEKRSMVLGYSDLITYRTSNSTLSSFIQKESMTVAEYEYLMQSLYSAISSSSEYASQYATMLEYLIYDTEKYFNAESYICGMVEYVTVDIIPARYCLTGHGETKFSKTEIGYYVGETVGLTYNALDLTDGGKIPEDAVSILILAPTKDISNAEAKMLIDYLNGGGQITVITSNENLEMTNLMSVMAAYNMSAEAGVVGSVTKVEVKAEVQTEDDETGDDDASDDNEGSEENNTEPENKEPVYETLYGDEVKVAINTDHKAMADLKGMSVTPTVIKGNSIIYESKNNITATPLLTSTGMIYMGEDKENTTENAVALAVIAEKANGGTLLWFTGADSYNHAILESTQDTELAAKIYSSCALILGSLGLAPLTYETDLTLPDATYYGERLMSVTETSYVLYTVVIIVLAVAFAITGVIVWYKRKKA